MPLSRLSTADIAGEVRRSGIVPFDRLVAQSLSQSPYREAHRAFRVLDKVPPSAARRPPITSRRLYPPWYMAGPRQMAAPARNPPLMLHRKTLLLHDFGSVTAIEDRFVGFERYYESIAAPFDCAVVPFIYMQGLGNIASAT